MSTSVLEIVQLPNGDIVLKRGDDDVEPLVSISFSEESKNYIDGVEIDIAKVMIQAGIQAVAHIHSSQLNDDGLDADLDGAEEHTLH